MVTRARKNDFTLDFSFYLLKKNLRRLARSAREIPETKWQLRHSGCFTGPAQV